MRKWDCWFAGGIIFAGLLFWVLVWAAWFILFARKHPSGDVRKIVIDPDDVVSIEFVHMRKHTETRYFYEFDESPDMRITDRDIITACVNELNTLSYTRYQGHWFWLDEPIFALTFHDDRPPVAYAVRYTSHKAIIIQEGDTDTFSIEYEPVPVVDSLARYKEWVMIRRWLKRLAEMPEWNEESLAKVQRRIEWYSRYCRHRPLPMPSSPLQLKEMLEGIPALTLEELMRYHPEN